MTDYEKLRNIRRYIVNIAAEVYTYTNWSSEFAAEQITKIPNSGRGICDNVDISELTAEQMKDLGFGKMDENSKSFLIPLWVLPFLREEIKTSCIDGSTIFKKIQNGYRQ